MSDHSQASKADLEAMRESDAHNLGQNEAVPGGAHAHSPAAHEAGAKPHTKPAAGEGNIIEMEETRRNDRGRDNNRGAGAGLRGNG